MWPARGTWIARDLSMQNFDLDALQWPAMVATLIAAWWVASERKGRRSLGFWCFALSNVLWVAWGWHAHAYALVALQIGLFALNLRGLNKTSPSASPEERA